MTDRELYKKCVLYGKQTLWARRKFIGLLPEVNKRRLYERRGFCSIFEFAAKLAGISHDQVNKILQLERRYEDKPVLHAALADGKISVNKLVRIASIATAENQNELVKKAGVLSSRALEIFVRDVKSEANNTAPKPLFDIETVHVHRLKLDGDVENLLVEMQEKGIDVNGFLRKCLEQRKVEIEREKEKLADAARIESSEKELIGMPVSRYVPVKIRRIIAEEHGIGCGAVIGGKRCNRRADNLHHEKRFAKVRVHDPRFLKPLCRAHHELEHAGEADYQKFRRMDFS